jgi:hypothetical protein
MDSPFVEDISAHVPPLILRFQLAEVTLEIRSVEEPALMSFGVRVNAVEAHEGLSV